MLSKGEKKKRTEEEEQLKEKTNRNKRWAATTEKNQQNKKGTTDRTLPEFWEDRLLKAKALGLNTIQTYTPWNLHEPKPGNFTFSGIADSVVFPTLSEAICSSFAQGRALYMCRVGFRGFSAWLRTKKRAPRLRSSDPGYLQWIENEFGSYGDDQAYLHHLVTLARGYLGNEVILYTTDGGTRETFEKGAVRGDAVFSGGFSTYCSPQRDSNLYKQLYPKAW